jgi:nitronate monooxygenase
MRGRSGAKALAGNVFLRKLGIDHPIIQAPMAGGATTPELVAACSNAGALGSFGCAYQTPEKILETVRKVRSLTKRPFNINLFAGGYEPHRHVDPAPMLALMAQAHADLGLPPPVLPPNPENPFDQQLEAVIEVQPAVFSFTFALPSADVLARVKARGIIVIGTATTVAEAEQLEAAEVDAIVAQGEEAGAHRGTFLKSFEESMVPMRVLVRDVVAAVSLPVIAAGGMMDGKDIAAALKLGAVAAQLGTAFLPCPESGTSDAHKKALLAARQDTTVITRAFSGRHARGLNNKFIEMVRPDAILPFGQQNDLTRAMRAAAAKKGDARYLSLWAGRGVTRSRALPAGELVKTLVAEIAAA